MKVGDVVWMFDSNRRVYPEGISAAPIYREHWTTLVIVGETAQSWLIGWNPRHPLHKAWKLSKKDPTRAKLQNRWYRIETSQQAVDADCWAHEHRYAIARIVQSVVDGEMLRRIVDLIGYQS